MEFTQKISKNIHATLSICFLLIGFINILNFLLVLQLTGIIVSLHIIYAIINFAIAYAFWHSRRWLLTAFFLNATTSSLIGVSKIFNAAAYISVTRILISLALTIFIFGLLLASKKYLRGDLIEPGLFIFSASLLGTIILHML